MLYEENVSLLVYVHKKGQLIRSRATERYRTVIDVETLKNGATKNIDILQVDVLRKRADGKIPCDQDMQDEDEYRIQQMIKNVGCIPTYWRQLAERMGLNQTNPICKTAIDYGKVETQLGNIQANMNTLDSTHKLHCTMMTALVIARDEPQFAVPGILELTFLYHGATYRETKNTRAYTAETLLGQIGGFVGMQ